MFFDCVVILDLFIFVPRNCSFKSLLYIFKKFDIFIFRESNNWNIKFSIIYLKCYPSCLSCCHSWNRWISSWIANYCKCYWYFRYYTIFWTCQMSNHVKSQLMANQEISKNYSDILMGKQILHLIYYYCLPFVPLILSYIEKIYLLLFCFYLSYYEQHNFHLHHHLFHLYDNFTNSLMSWNNCLYIIRNYTLA